MAVQLVTATFAGRVGQSFTATSSLSGEPLELVLSRCDESRHARPDHPAFSLIFHAPGPHHLPQQIFTIENQGLGEFELFLVPLGPGERGMAYEAVIN
jgi:hypothetical protein